METRTCKNPRQPHQHNYNQAKPLNRPQYLGHFASCWTLGQRVSYPTFAVHIPRFNPFAFLSATTQTQKPDPT